MRDVTHCRGVGRWEGEIESEGEIKIGICVYIDAVAVVVEAC